MVKKLRMKELSTALMLILFLGVSIFSVEGAILCFGKDGHIAIEFVNTCNGSDSGSQLAGAETDACGPCMDVQFLGSPVYTNRTQYTDAQTHILVSLALLSSSLPLEKHHYSPINLPEKPPYKTLASLQSVVLLI